MDQWKPYSWHNHQSWHKLNGRRDKCCNPTYIKNKDHKQTYHVWIKFRYKFFLTQKRWSILKRDGGGAHLTQFKYIKTICNYLKQMIHHILLLQHILLFGIIYFIILYLYLIIRKVLANVCFSYQKEPSFTRALFFEHLDCVFNGTHFPLQIDFGTLIFWFIFLELIFSCIKLSNFYLSQYYFLWLRVSSIEN